MNDCVFCRIAAHEIQSKLVYEDDCCVAFDDLRPQAPVHVLVIPKIHTPSTSELIHGEVELSNRLLTACVKVAEIKGIARTGYRIVTNTGEHGGQTVFHLHFHVLGGRPLSWPPG